MFNNKACLPHLLRPAQYSDGEQYKLEINNLFRTAWHFVGTTSEVRSSGDFVTVEVLGEPVQIRNFEGSLRAYQNVCAHRHSLLTHASRGHDRQLRCQYHGWEYDEEGKLARITDGKSFHGMGKADARRLVTYPVDSCGQLMFVALTAEVPPLREQLSVNVHHITAAFNDDWEEIDRFTIDHDANWKIAVENSLESYHLPVIHAKTFGTIYPFEHEMRHSVGDRFTRLDDKHKYKSRLIRWFHREAGREPIYTHLHCYPNLLLVWAGLHSIVQSVCPISPTKCQSKVRIFIFKGQRRGVLSSRVRYLAYGRHHRNMTRLVMNEDASVFGDIQKGMNASRHEGVIGAREERIFSFQEYVLNMVAGSGSGHSERSDGTRDVTGKNGEGVPS
ncbi:MAG: aromatic ring-hydroxylating oxygenase subunit alpha [Candidatus Binataceae bacterium]